MLTNFKGIVCFTLCHFCGDLWEECKIIDRDFECFFLSERKEKKKV